MYERVGVRHTRSLLFVPVIVAMLNIEVVANVRVVYVRLYDDIFEKNTHTNLR